MRRAPDANPRRLALDPDRESRVLPEAYDTLAGDWLRRSSSGPHNRGQE